MFPTCFKYSLDNSYGSSKRTCLQLYLLKSNDDFPLEKTLCLKIPVVFCGAVLLLFLQCSSQPPLPCLAGRTECQPEKSQTGLGMVSKSVSSNYFSIIVSIIVQIIQMLVIKVGKVSKKLSEEEEPIHLYSMSMIMTLVSIPPMTGGW